MHRKHAILFGIAISIFLLLVATMHYPGGAQYDKNSTGYDWQNNYFSNLFSIRAINGLENPSRVWAIGGMFFFCFSSALFFIEFSKKISSKSAAVIIKYFGVGAMISTFLVVTPYHDTMINISTTLALISMFYIAVFVFKSKLHFFKILCVVCLIVFYSCIYMYYTQSYLEFLPLMQKISFVIAVIWILGLEYFTKRDDFQHINIAESKRSEEVTNR
jgi:hypothetical protein